MNDPLSIPLPQRASIVSVEDETTHLLELYGGDVPAIMNLVASQFAILATRSQTILQLAGITISITGMSGVGIARSGRLAAVLLLTGLVIVLFTAGIIMIGILRVRWNSQMRSCGREDAIRSALAMRNAKTRMYGGALVLLVVGLTFYLASIGVVLVTNLP